ncbi:MAG: ATP-binding protein [Pseudomonadota bacterium]
MNLRAQLVLIAALGLVLPWAGCEYVRQTERGLRENQLQLLELTAANVASALSDVSFDPAAQQNLSGGTLYLAPLSRAPALDGFESDWLPARPAQQALSGDTDVAYLAAEQAGSAYVYLQCPSKVGAELIVIAVGDDQRARSVAIDLTARGGSAPAVSPPRPGFPPPQVVVEPGNQRIHVELRLPLPYLRLGLGLRVEDAQGDVVATSFTASLPPPPIRQLDSLDATLQRFADVGVRIDVASAEGWRLASVGTTSAPSSFGTASGPLPPRLLRLILDDPPTEEVVDIDVERISGPLVERALAGRVTSARHVGSDGLRADVIAGAPIRRNANITGAVVVSQRSAAQLLAGNEALQRLALVTVVLTVTTVLLLAGYAGWLSLRIRRLARAADAAMDARGELQTRMPGSGAYDEIGDLSRSVESLLARVRDYNDYLKALAGRLSHELATPLSVVSSSLDNLESATLGNEQTTYTERARDGVARLRNVLSAMREATRIEEVVANATFVRLDLGPVLNGVVEGYRGAYPAHRFEFRSADSATVRIAPTLLVQLLDKIVDNAASFAPEDSTITVALARQGAAAVITVDNDGPTLSDEQIASIFGSLVSYRQEGSGMHMGFGLYIAQLIAAGHDGRLVAENRADGSGVRFLLILPIGA